MISKIKATFIIVTMQFLFSCSYAPLVKWQSEVWQSRIIRTVTVEIIADEYYAIVEPDWEYKSRKNLIAASRFMESNFGIKLFITKSSECSLPEENRIENFLEKARAVPSEADIKIIFSSQPFYKSENNEILSLSIAGYTEIMGNCILIFDNKEGVILHELGHIFGAQHIKDRDSIMHRGTRSGYLDEESGKIIFRNKYREFK